MYTSTLVSGLVALSMAAAQFANTTTTGTAAGTFTCGPGGPTGAVVVTETVTELTTFCPEATEITTNGKTYTATASETLTITDCPCTRTKTTLPTPTANGTVFWTTVDVTAYTTVCPEATEITTNGKTYTATASETITITDCPCQSSYAITKPTSPATVYQNATTTLYTTEVVSTLTLECPVPTTIITNGMTIPVPVPTTLTISEGCPCTVTVPVSSSAATPTVAVPAPVSLSSAKVGPAPTTQVAGVSTAPAIATGAASTIGSSFIAWIAAGLFAMAA